MEQVTLVGATVLSYAQGSLILNVLAGSSDVQRIKAFARRDMDQNSKVETLKSEDSQSWPTLYPTDSQVFISALGTTRARAGGLANQRKIDFDLNLNLAKAAKEAGTKCFVLISSAGANSASRIPYTKMKGELDDAVSKLGFDHVVIVRPGLIVGQRQESIMMESVFGALANGLGSITGNRLKDFWAQDAEVIARAAVHAAKICVEGRETEKVRILEQLDVVRLGRTEWKE